MIENIQDVVNTLEQLSNDTDVETTKNEIIDCIKVIKKTIGNIRKVDDLKINIGNALDALLSASSYIGEAENYLEKL